MNLFLCTMCITIELWSSVEKLSEGIILFCVFFFIIIIIFLLVLVTALLLSLRTDPHSTCRSLLLSDVFVWWVDEDV